MSARYDFAGRDIVERRDAFYWRFVVTAVSFLVFGVAAVVVGAVLLPLVRLAPAAREAKRMRARAVLRLGLRVFIGVMNQLRGLTYEFQGVEKLGRPGQLIVANHPSLIDVVFLLAFTPRGKLRREAGSVAESADP